MSLCDAGNIRQLRGEAYCLAKFNHAFCYCHAQIASSEFIKVGRYITVFLVHRAYDSEFFFNRRSEENSIVRIHKGARTPVGKYIHQRKAVEMRSAGASDHDGITSQVGA